ncbi:MAG: sugar phosphate nucleotidyltransferase [Bacteroidales bacterium]|nr:sugar phosphate nucleotidyltransferase [Bacteroidales bacterium]
MKPTLVILAAGMGSRYGGLKQLDGIGPNGETIMDYSVYDAIRAGFGKIVFIIRHSFEQEFRTQVLSKYKDRIAVEVVFQELNSLPEGFVCPEGREKPWGTNHAVMMAANVVNEPFAVINADDFYGSDSFVVLSKFLQSVEHSSNHYCMVSYLLGNTLSENGTVSRGECGVDKDNHLATINERTKIARDANGKIHCLSEDGETLTLLEDTPVSMNMWGFTPDYFNYSLKSFIRFLSERGTELKSEFYIPTMVNELISTKTVVCDVLKTNSHWFGVTYHEDKPVTIARIKELINKGLYPEQLWK